MFMSFYDLGTFAFSELLDEFPVLVTGVFKHTSFDDSEIFSERYYIKGSLEGERIDYGV